jgi:hypothetical protein
VARASGTNPGWRGMANLSGKQERIHPMGSKEKGMVEISLDMAPCSAENLYVFDGLLLYFDRASQCNHKDGAYV